MAESIFTGVKVIEVCNMVAGPYCTKMLADMGAEVIKVEKPGIGDEARTRGSFPGDVPHPERSALFLYLNTNKLGVTLNLETTKGRDIFKELVKDADLVVEDNPPGFMAGLGLNYEVLNELNPRLIMTSITPFGQTGPHKDYKAYPINTFHSGGEGYLTPSGNPFPDRPPLKMGRFVGEYEAGIQSALATAIALYWQRISGLGQYVDVSKQEVLMAISLMDLMVYPTAGMLATRVTRMSPEAGLMPCKDGYIQLDMHEEIQWRRLAKLMGDPEWTQTDIFKTREARQAHAEEIRQHLREWLSDWSKEELYNAARKHGIPAAAYFNAEEIVRSPQLRFRGFIVDIDHPQAGKLEYPSAPYRFSKTPWRGNRPAPLLGEHNEDIYIQHLDYSKQDLVRLRGLGVI
ncbi:CaiB/BaiF CoA transferase family protein [Chloroflexota bacterium]